MSEWRQDHDEARQCELEDARRECDEAQQLLAIEIEQKEDARYWARYYRGQVKHEGHPRGYICQKCRAFDALPWAKEEKR